MKKNVGKGKASPVVVMGNRATPELTGGSSVAAEAEVARTALTGDAVGQGLGDPRHPEVVIQGKAYRLDFSFRSLCAAEAAFEREGQNLNLLFCLAITTLNLNRTRKLFAAAVKTHHPELRYEEAIALVDDQSIYEVANCAIDALKSFGGRAA